ncbi:MAG: trypsin-like peptidase domain-containing protein [Flavobacteriales bacterium]|nr:trypsin-like peptidase domain-containing protein [Flavobacteriales bacterium]
MIITRSVTPEEYEYIEDEVRAQMKAQLKKRVITELSVDYSGEDYRIEREMARIEAERARERERIEREEAVENEKRISRFYEVVFSRFSGKLLPVEGIYRSIFKGDNQAYDLVILKRIDRFREYKAYVFESRKGDLKVGYPVFTLESTAQSNSFLVDYSTRGGFDIDDKLAILDQGMINLGERSFIKIFPIEGQSERDSKLRPKVDFDRSGSGVIVSSTGLVLTNHHVIDQAKSIIIQLRDSSGNKLESEARVLREQRENDIAVLQILNASLIPSEQIYPELITDVRLGQEVYTMGYPISTKMGENMKVVDGIISSLTGAQDDQKYIQTTLPVWYGNSGGPCFNDRGQLIGLVTSVMYHQGEKAEGVAYVTKAQGILDLLEGLEFDQNDPNSSEIPLEVLIEKYSPLSVFIKVKF